MKTETNSALRGDATRDALIAAATQVFSRDGFHAASLREIAEVAKVNQALIGYHFRNKEGLYLAVFEHIVKQVQERVGPTTDEIDAALATSNNISTPEKNSKYFALLLRLTDSLVIFIAQEQSASWSQLILREHHSPTAAFSVLYDGFMGHVLDILTKLVQQLRKNDSITDARLLVATILGQVFVFRSARAGMLRHMGWEHICEDELSAIQIQIRQNLTALFITGD